MRTAWLLRDGDVLATVEIAESMAERSLGLLGRSTLEGALLLRRTRSVHTLGMRYPLDVGFLDDGMKVVAVRRLPTWRVTLPKPGCRHVLEAPAGSFERWSLAPGDVLELREER
ncbi:MAG: DUF192 domain-containing protein [Acidimicrobiales bacterium]